MASNVFMSMKQAHRGAAEVRKVGTVMPTAWSARLSQIVLGYFNHRWNRLDIEEAPSSVKRDLGFLDGHAPYREEDRMH